jgi:hypothetical protein
MEGARVLPAEPFRVRAVTNCHVGENDIDIVLKAVEKVMAENR